jgi:hypothetical protein
MQHRIGLTITVNQLEVVTAGAVTGKNLARLRATADATAYPHIAFFVPVPFAVALLKPMSANFPPTWRLPFRKLKRRFRAISGKAPELEVISGHATKTISGN